MPAQSAEKRLEDIESISQQFPLRNGKKTIQGRFESRKRANPVRNICSRKRRYLRTAERQIRQQRGIEEKIAVAEYAAKGFKAHYNS
jgi:hypothetical protein